MAKTKRPGQSTGENGGIYQQVGPGGRPKPNFVTVPDNRPMPPTTKPGDQWKPVKITPASDR